MASFELTQEIVRELLDYSPETGGLTWRQRARKWFNDDRSWKAWNARYAGKPALTCARHDDGRLHGSIFSRDYKTHRVIFFWMTGEWPTRDIDHENQKAWDNRWTNLREATKQQNGKNKRLSRRSTTGYVGVSPHKTLTLGVRYRAYIHIGGKRRHLGYYATKKEAIAARLAASKAHGFSILHGSSTLSAAERG
jgi:hypothetical protein